MAQFEEVLDGVRLALTWASPAEIQPMLEGLVEERIISEAYSKSLSLRQVTEGVAPKPADGKTADLMGSPGSTDHQHLSQTLQLSIDSAGSEHFSPTDAPDGVRTWSELHQPVMDEHYPNDRLFSTPMVCDYQCSLGLDKKKALLTSEESVGEQVSDNESMNVGNSEDVKEWLEQVEEAARKIAVPLWQNWDRGRTMLLPLVPALATCCGRSEHSLIGCEAQCPVLTMEEETELEIACRILDLYDDNFICTDEDTADPYFTLDTQGVTDNLKGLDFSTDDRVAPTCSNSDRLVIPESAWNALPAETRTSTSSITDVCWTADRTAYTTLDPLCLTGDVQCGLPAFTEDIAKDTYARNNSSNTDHSMTSSGRDHVFRADSSTKTCSMDSITDEERMDSHWGAKMQEVDQDMDIPSYVDLPGSVMQEVDQDPHICPDLGDLPGFFQEMGQDKDILDYGDLPDDLSEYLNEDCLWKIMGDLSEDLNEDHLRTIVESDVLFGDPWLSCTDESNCGDVPLPIELPGADSHQQEDKLSDQANKRKRSRGPGSRWCNDESTPSRPKTQRAADRSKTEEIQTVQPTVTQGTDKGSEPSSAEVASVSTTPPRILHFHPSIQFITIPDTPGYQVVQTLRLSPPVLRLPLRNTAATPTYILVPAASPCRMPPLSPVDGAVAPVQMSSSPPGSLSDTASKAMSPPYASPISPNNEMSICKESPLPQSPTVFDIPQVVKDYIQGAKAHMSQICQHIEPGLSLTSHYIDVRVSQRDIIRSRKNSNKYLNKALTVMGDTDRQKSLLRQSQMFEGSNGDKNKRYIVLFGNAGMGKTTLIKKLCLDWSKDGVPQFDFVFLLDGKSLILTEPIFSLQTLLLNISSLASPCSDPEAVFTQILAAPKRVLIVFDGFDELRDYETLLQTQEKDLVTSLQRDNKGQNYTVRQLYSAILQRVLLPGCTLLLSTRPRGTASQLLRRAGTFLEVCGFTPTDVETYLSLYFADPALRASALDCLRNCSYLHLLCWNPGLCRLVCLILEQSKSLDVLPRTLSGLCHQVLHLKIEKGRDSTHSQAETQTETSAQSVDGQISSTLQEKRSHKRNVRTKSRAQVRSQRGSRAKKQKTEEDEVDEEELSSDGREVDGTGEREMLSQLGSLAWEGVKVNSSIVPTGPNMSAKLKAFGHRTGLLSSYYLRTRHVSNGERTRGGREDREAIGRGENGNRGSNDEQIVDASDDHILLWENPFIQSYLAGVHLALSRSVSDRAFLQTLPLQTGPKGRRRPQREELELTQRFAVGLLFHNRTELLRLHSYVEPAFRDMGVGKQALLTKHLEGLLYDDLSPAQILEVCHYVYEASSTHGDDSRDNGSAQLLAHLAENLPEVLTFCGVPLNSSDVFAVKKVLERGGAEGRSFCLDLEDSGIQIAGLRALVGLSNINTYRACIADVITLWEQLEQSGEDGLRQGAVSKFKIHPLKATQVCHIEHLAKLVNIHMHKRLSDRSSKSDSVLAEGVPAVKELHKLEFELGPENAPLAFPKLWELLPGLHNLQHLDLDKSKIGDKEAEKLVDTLVSLRFLEVLNLSQNCIGDQGVKKLAGILGDLPRLHCLSLYSNVISDEGAESLAAVLPHMASLTDLDVKYNKLTGVGAQILGVSLRNCKQMKTLRMWNQCIPYGVFERLQQQDSRILWH